MNGFNSWGVSILPGWGGGGRTRLLVLSDTVMLSGAELLRWDDILSLALATSCLLAHKGVKLANCTGHRGLRCLGGMWLRSVMIVSVLKMCKSSAVIACMAEARTVGCE